MMELFEFFVPDPEALRMFAAVVFAAGGSHFFSYRTRLTREALRRYDGR